MKLKYKLKRGGELSNFFEFDITFLRKKKSDKEPPCFSRRWSRPTQIIAKRFFCILYPSKVCTKYSLKFCQVFKILPYLILHSLLQILSRIFIYYAKKFFTFFLWIFCNFMNFFYPTSFQNNTFAEKKNKIFRNFFLILKILYKRFQKPAHFWIKDFQFSKTSKIPEYFWFPSPPDRIFK